MVTEPKNVILLLTQAACVESKLPPHMSKDISAAISARPGIAEKPLQEEDLYALSGMDFRQQGTARGAAPLCLALLKGPDTQLAKGRGCFVLLTVLCSGDIPDTNGLAQPSTVSTPTTETVRHSLSPLPHSHYRCFPLTCRS